MLCKFGFIWGRYTLVCNSFSSTICCSANLGHCYYDSVGSLGHIFYHSQRQVLVFSHKPFPVSLYSVIYCYIQYQIKDYQIDAVEDRKREIIKGTYQIVYSDLHQ